MALPFLRLPADISFVGGDAAKESFHSYHLNRWQPKFPEPEAILKSAWKGTGIFRMDLPANEWGLLVTEG